MQIIRGLDNIPASVLGGVLTIGNFDGVHRGHQQLIDQAGLCAAESGCSVVVATFDPHPLSVVAPERAPETLMPLEMRARFMADAGASMLVVLKSEPALLGLEPQDFVRDIIVERFEPTHVVEGHDFGFGRGRRGDVQFLEALGRQYGFQTVLVESIRLQVSGEENVVVSSSMIRRLIKGGQVHRAQLCLGRPYALHAVVQIGQRRGRTIGYPTVNLGDIRQLIPPPGVYAGSGTVQGQSYPAAISIGDTPTFGGTDLQVEAHLLGCHRTLYGQAVELSFWKFLREQKKFESAGKLREQIARDVEEVRREAGYHTQARLSP